MLRIFSEAPEVAAASATSSRKHGLSQRGTLRCTGCAPAMPKPELAADCRRCAALCCVSLAFDQSQQFAFDKPAGVPCPHLSPGDRCRIHPRLEERGFAGCARYDCLGAGQRVTQEVLPGRHWRQGPTEARRVFEAFRGLRSVHAALELLESAARLPLSPSERASCRRLSRLLSPSAPWSEQALAEFEQSPVFHQVRAFLESLRASVERSGKRRLPIVTGSPKGAPADRPARPRAADSGSPSSR